MSHMIFIDLCSIIEDFYKFNAHLFSSQIKVKKKEKAFAGLPNSNTIVCAYVASVYMRILWLLLFTIEVIKFSAVGSHQ